jgi:hypothetical protein
MNCDQVFNVLTRGPFPTGDPGDEEVEAHLEFCSDCWRLAEALRPAIEVFQEAVPPSESRDLPGYWGDARPAATVFAELTQSNVRTVVAAEIRKMARPGRKTYPVENRTSLIQDVVIVTGFLAALSALAVGLAVLWQAWR